MSGAAGGGLGVAVGGSLSDAAGVSAGGAAKMVGAAGLAGVASAASAAGSGSSAASRRGGASRSSVLGAAGAAESGPGAANHRGVAGLPAAARAATQPVGAIPSTAAAATTATTTTAAAGQPAGATTPAAAATSAATAPTPAARPGRFLLVVPPLVGHINPAAGVAAALAARGHEVAWAGHRGLIARLAGPGAQVLECSVPASASRPADLRGPGALKFLWETFLIPLADAMVPGVAAAVEAFAPDVMLVDQQAVAGAVVAMRRGIPWATSATTAAELGNPLAAMPKVDAWVRQLLFDFETRNGLPTTPDSPRYQSTYGDLRFSPHLVLAYSTAALSGEVEALRGTLRYVGPSITERPPDPALPAFPWHRLPAGRRLVFVSVGTANADAGASFLRACADAIGDRPHLFGVVADPGAVLTAPLTAPLPDNILAVPHAPQLDLLQRAEAAICHAGQNTVCEALYHGVPLIVAPIRDDQPVVAQQVAAAGAGIRIRFAHAGRAQIGAALDQLLGDPAFAAAAGRISESFRAAKGASAAAEHLESLLALGSGNQGPYP